MGDKRRGCASALSAQEIQSIWVEISLGAAHFLTVPGVFLKKFVAIHASNLLPCKAIQLSLSLHPLVVLLLNHDCRLEKFANGFTPLLLSDRFGGNFLSPPENFRDTLPTRRTQPAGAAPPLPNAIASTILSLPCSH